jgi:hypothetical protein
MTSVTRSSAARRPRVPSAMAMSRSVTTPTTSSLALTTGTMPQSAFHIISATSARLASGWHRTTPLVMAS